MDLPKYLVRPDDFAIFKLNDEGLYNQDERWAAQSHFTFQNLTENYDFFPATEEELPEWEKKHRLYMDWLLWHCRPDGHGGRKGGTMEEYLQKIRHSQN